MDTDAATRVLIEQMLELAKENQRSIQALAARRADTLVQPSNGKFSMLLTLIGTLAVLLIVLVQGGQNTAAATLSALSEKLDQEMADRKAAISLLDITLQNEVAKEASFIEREIGRLDTISDARHQSQQDELVYRHNALSERLDRLELR